MTFAENEKLECLIKLTYIDDDMSDVKAFKAMDVSDVVLSDKLNKRVDKLINKSNHNKRIMIKKSTVRLLVAAVIMDTLIIASILSISAVRDAIRNAIVDFFEEYVSVHFIPQSDNAESTSDELPSADATSVETLSNLNSIQEYKRPKLPEEYNMVELMKTSGMYCFEIYLNDVDSVMYIQKLLDAEDSDFTNEGAQVEEIQVDGMEGVIITNPDGYNMIALSDNYYVYTLSGKADKDLLIYFASLIE